MKVLNLRSQKELINYLDLQISILFGINETQSNKMIAMEQIEISVDDLKNEMDKQFYLSAIKEYNN